MNRPGKLLTKTVANLRAGRAQKLLAAATAATAERAATTVLPAVGSLYVADGLAGLYFHLRGVQRKPGGFKEITYNLPMARPPSPRGHWR